MKLYFENIHLGSIDTGYDISIEDAIILLDVDLDEFALEGLHLEQDDYTEAEEDDLNAFFGL